jgi:hypothetical protein
MMKMMMKMMMMMKMKMMMMMMNPQGEVKCCGSYLYVKNKY